MSATLEKTKRASIYTVAAAVGVSKATVARVVNNDCRVAPDTVLAVREAIERLDYRPKPVKNRPGPRLRRRKPVRHQQVALLFGGPPIHRHTPVYSRVIQGVESRLQEDGWNLVVRYMPTERPWEAMPHRLDGVLLFGVGGSDPRFMRELRSTTAVRIMAQPKEGDFFDHVTYDEDKIGQVAAAYLVGKGHRRLACFGKGGGRTMNFVQIAREAGAEVTEITVRTHPYDESGKVQMPNREAMAEVASGISRLDARATGIYMGADVLAMGLHHALLAAGLNPGTDIEIVGTNNDAALLDALHPRPASVDIHAGGRTALLAARPRPRTTPGHPARTGNRLGVKQ